MSKITVEGTEYRVLETLPFHGLGKPAKTIIVDGHERVAVKEGGAWRFWGSTDRMSGGPASRGIPQ